MAIILITTRTHLCLFRDSTAYRTQTAVTCPAIRDSGPSQNAMAGRPEWSRCQNPGRRPYLPQIAMKATPRRYHREVIAHIYC